MYKVVKRFHDLKDECYEYGLGDIYPREGYKPSEARIAELASDKNAQGVPLIEPIKAAAPAAPKEAAKKPAAKPKKAAK